MLVTLPVFRRKRKIFCSSSHLLCTHTGQPLSPAPILSGLCRCRALLLYARRGRSTLSCGKLRCKPHFVCLTEPQGNVTGRRGTLITPATEVRGWTKEISSSACERDKECKHAGMQTLAAEQSTATLSLWAVSLRPSLPPACRGCHLPLYPYLPLLLMTLRKSRSG